MSKAVYMKGDTALTADQRKLFAGCRLENADYFQGVSSGIETAVVIGDYPDIEKALKDKGIDFEVDSEVTDPEVTLYSVTKVDGKRASKSGLTFDEANTFVSENPDVDYVIEAE